MEKVPLEIIIGHILPNLNYTDIISFLKTRKFKIELFLKLLKRKKIEYSLLDKIKRIKKLRKHPYLIYLPFKERDISLIDHYRKREVIDIDFNKGFQQLFVRVINDKDEKDKWFGTDIVTFKNISEIPRIADFIKSITFTGQDHIILSDGTTDICYRGEPFKNWIPQISLNTISIKDYVGDIQIEFVYVNFERRFNLMEEIIDNKLFDKYRFKINELRFLSFYKKEY